ncbi:unnamed protein product, partial [Meganyctiphanes norvegica]
MPKVKSGRVYGGCFPDYELRRRETGIKTQIGWESSIRKSLYTAMLPCTSWDPRESDTKTGLAGYGGVFNLEFSPDGSHLVAACEQRALMVFDPLTRKAIHNIPYAHQNCVNCIRFLDTRVFASCSDDHTVALWDVRNLKRKVRLLEGHSNWVKNIEYSAADGILVTSGFDGKILSWDINNKCGIKPLVNRKIKYEQGMQFLCTDNENNVCVYAVQGYLQLIHMTQFDVTHMQARNYHPTMYRLMQLSNTPLPQAVGFTKLFHAKRNRVEFISDFPASNDAEVIHSLQVHPQGWCVLSRNTSMEDSSEWSCVHDIQDIEDQDEDEKEFKDIDPYDDLPSEANFEASVSENQEPLEIPPPASNNNNNNNNNSNVHLSLTFSPRVEITLRNSNETMDEGGVAGSSNSSNNSDVMNNGVSSSSRSSSSLNNSSGGASNSGVGEGGGSSGSGVNIQFRFTSMDVFEALEHIRERREEQRAGRNTSRGQSVTSNTSSNNSRSRYVGNRPPPFSVRSRQEREREQNVINNNNVPENPPRTVGNVLDPRNAFYIRTGSGNHRAILLLRPGQNHPRYLRQVDPNHKIARNIPRLTHYIKEPNVGRGFIKELCFNSDGRLICSPYAHGVRLMMFDSKCSELSTCVTSTPQQLYDVSTSICHSNCVVSTKFSPTHCLLVSGCLNGKIVWHQPVL